MSHSNIVTFPQVCSFENVMRAKYRFFTRWLVSKDIDLTSHGRFEDILISSFIYSKGSQKEQQKMFELRSKEQSRRKASHLVGMTSSNCDTVFELRE